MSQGLIQVPLEFFRKERATVYGQWREAFWRELLANSIDAGADEIRITLGDTSVVFSDNGPGMPLDVCENVYLFLGKSTKGADGDGVGGFGRARILTCFSMDKYSIKTQNYHLTGSGVNYSIRKLQGDHEPSSYLGFTLEVEDPEMLKGLMHAALRKVLSRCGQLNVKIFLDGEQLYWTPLVRREKSPLVTSFGTISLETEPSAASSDLVVRVNGLVMYWQWTSGIAGKCLLVELDPATSRNHLTASRDNGKPEFRDAISILLKNMNQAGADTFRASATDVFKVFQGTSAWNVAGTAPVAARRETASPVFNSLLDNLRSRADVREMTVEGCHLAYKVKTSDEKLTALGMAWDPEVWMTQPARQHAEKWELLAAWEAAVDYSWEVFHAHRPTDDEAKPWSIGLIFASALASISRIEVGWETGFLFSINPYKPSYTDQGTEWVESWDLRGYNGARKLLAAGLHEVAHVLNDEHDTDYASTLTHMFGLCDQAEGVFRILSAIKRVRKALKVK